MFNKIFLFFCMPPEFWERGSDNSPFNYETPENPFEIQEGPHEDGISIPDTERITLLDYVSWEKHPPFTSPGRSAFVRRKAPLRLPNAVVAGYKLKGVGSCDRDEKIVKPPESVAYQVRVTSSIADPRDDIRTRILRTLPTILIHRGVADDGSFRPVLDPPKPLGGLSPSRGQREFEIATELFKTGVPACMPVTWGRYPDLLWEGQPMEFVILAESFFEADRFGAYFDFTPSASGAMLGQKMRTFIEQKFGIREHRKQVEPAFEFMGQVAKMVGGLLRQAHQKAGVARFAGHMGNITYVPENHSVFMHDFDSSVKLADLHPYQRSISILRDLESSLVGLFLSIAHSCIFYLLKNPEEMFAKGSPIQNFLDGYFSEPRAADARKTYGDMLTKIAIQLLIQRRRIPSITQQSEWSTLAHFSFGRACLETGLLVYQQSELADQHVLPYDIRTLRAYMDRYDRECGVVFARRQKEILDALPPEVRRIVMGS